jgi:hypothetical protein
MNDFRSIAGRPELTESYPDDIDAAIETAVEQAFNETFEDDYHEYWTLILPARPPHTDQCMNPWYSQDLALTRGVFYRERDAPIWAHEHLKGGPYSVKFCGFKGETDKPLAPFQVGFASTLALHGWPKDRDCLAADTSMHEQGCEYADEREWDDPNMGGREVEPFEDYNEPWRSSREDSP